MASSKTRQTKTIIVTIGDEALGSIEAVATELRARGMTIKRVMPKTGVIAGSTPYGRLSALKKVGGVSSVEEEAVAELPPPNEKLQ